MRNRCDVHELIGFARLFVHRRRGWCLLGYSDGNLSVSSFAAIVSVTLLATGYLGGITSFGGAVIAGTIAPLGVLYTFIHRPSTRETMMRSWLGWA